MSHYGELSVAQLRRMPYADYLETTHWRCQRRAALERDGFRCRRCRSWEKTLHVHHLSYERRGDEEPDDLETLCEDCHRSDHPSWNPVADYFRRQTRCQERLKLLDEKTLCEVVRMARLIPKEPRIGTLDFPFVDKLARDAFRPVSQRESLREYLCTLDGGQMAELMALMWLGRSPVEKSFAGLVKHARGNQFRAARDVSQKPGLASLLIDGVARLAGARRLDQKSEIAFEDEESRYYVNADLMIPDGWIEERYGSSGDLPVVCPECGVEYSGFAVGELCGDQSAAPLGVDSPCSGRVIPADEGMRLYELKELRRRPRNDPRK